MYQVYMIGIEKNGKTEVVKIGETSNLNKRFRRLEGKENTLKVYQVIETTSKSESLALESLIRYTLVKDHELLKGTKDYFKPFRVTQKILDRNIELLQVLRSL